MDELEDALRRFQPRRPKPLPDVDRSRRVRPLVWIAAAGIAAGIVIMVSQRDATPVVQAPSVDDVTLGALNTHAIRGIDDLDQALTRASPRLLPDVNQPGGVLYALSKE